MGQEALEFGGGKKNPKKTLKKNPNELDSNPQLETPARLLKCQNLEGKKKEKRLYGKEEKAELLTNQ
jgi:hypothetical protein